MSNKSVEGYLSTLPENEADSARDLLADLEQNGERYRDCVAILKRAWTEGLHTLAPEEYFFMHVTAWMFQNGTGVGSLQALADRSDDDGIKRIVWLCRVPEFQLSPDLSLLDGHLSH